MEEDVDRGGLCKNCELTEHEYCVSIQYSLFWSVTYNLDFIVFFLPLDLT